VPISSAEPRPSAVPPESGLDQRGQEFTTLLKRVAVTEIIFAKRPERSGGARPKTFAKPEGALRKGRAEESRERDQSGKPKTERDGKRKWQEAYAGTLARIVPVWAPGHRARRLPVRLPGAGRPERVLRVHEVYFAELACGKKTTNARTVEGGLQRLNPSKKLLQIFQCWR
jgi:hypothetical protein